MNILVAGAGGFLGGHLVERLLDEGHAVRAVDVKSLDKWWQVPLMNHNSWSGSRDANLAWRECCEAACSGMDWVFNLAADMGGISYIENNKAACMDSVLINAHLLRAARRCGVKRYLFTSSACVYRADKQDQPNQPPLKEEDAYPASPEDGYGWEKLFSERHCRHYMEDYGLDCRVVRLHNVYGPNGSWCDGREKAPAAICRKVAEAKLNGDDHITIYGDGTRQRTFMWIDDCVEGLLKIMRSEICQPINLGIQHEVVTINDLVGLVQTVAGTDLEIRHDMTKAQGVFGRSSDNTLIRQELSWEPTTPLAVGLEEAYQWVEKECRKQSAE